MAAAIGLVYAASAAGASFDFLSKGRYYPASRTLQLPYKSLGVTNLTLRLDKCLNANLNAYRLESDSMCERMVKIAEKRYALTPPYDQTANRMLPLGEIFGVLEPGYYRLSVDTGVDIVSSSSWWTWHSRLKGFSFFALTDLGLAIASSPSRESPCAVVIVHSLKDGRPVAGARVSVLTLANEVAGEGISDANGVARVPIVPEYKDSPANDIRGVLAISGSDISYLALDWDGSVLVRDSSGQASLEEARAFLFAERDLCRPGESFDTGLFLRSSPQGGMNALGNAPIELELWDPNNNRIESRRIMTDRWGFAAANWPIPASARIGSWTVKAKLADKTLGEFCVGVRAYVPDRFHVKAEIERGKDLNEPPMFKGVATYYFGEKVREGKWKLSTWAVPARPLPQWNGWSVGTDTVPCNGQTELSGSLTEGTFGATFLQSTYQKLMAGTSPFELHLGADVTPPGARTVTGSTSLRFNPTESYLGVRSVDSPVADRTVFEVTTLAADGGTCAPVTDEVVVSFEKREWQCHIVKRGNGYCTEWREDKVAMPSLSRTVRLSETNAVARLEYLAKEIPSGLYVLSATGGVRATKMEFWHCAGEVSSRSVSPSSLHLTSDIAEAKPGDVVNLKFRAAYAGHAYVVAGERGIEFSCDFDVKPGDNTFAVPIRKDAVSKVTYVGLTVINRDAPNMFRQTGIAEVKVGHPSSRYPIELSIPDVVRPGETVGVKLKSDGAGAVRLMAVDEGVLVLSDYATPDAFAHFYDYDFGCPFEMCDVYSQVYPDLRVLPNGQIGGGGDLGMMKRACVRTRKDSTLKQRETVRIVLPLVEIPSSGEATVPVTMPDFTGSLRFMAVAVDDARAGATEKSVIVRDAASVFVNAPRYVTGGDRYKIAVEIFNHDLPASDWSLTIVGKTFSGHLAKGGCTNVTFSVSEPMDANGTMAYDGVLKIGGETYRDRTFVTVRPKNPPIVETLYSFSTNVASVTDWARIDEDVTERFDSPKPALASALKWLEEYPYGCLEQTTAAAFPFLCAEELRKLGLADFATASNAALKVKAAYGNIMQMALNDGSFSMWPGGRGAWQDGTLFALHFIFAAERQGLVKPNPRAKMIRWLRRKADGNNPKTRIDRAYAAYILALAGEKGFENAARNVLAYQKSDFAMLLASAALIRGGFASDGALAYAEALETRVWESFDLPASDGWSKTKTYATVLALTAENGVENADLVAPLVAKLMGALRTDGSAWGTTRDNAWATYGLAKWCAAHTNACSITRRRIIGIPKTLKPKKEVIRVVRDFPKCVTRGDLVEVSVELSAGRSIDRAVLCDLVPGGFELEDATLKTRASDDDEDDESIGQSEIRDDRWLWFGPVGKISAGAKPLVLKYRLRATTRGTFTVPTLVVEDMYDPDCRGTVVTDHTVVVE